MYDKWALKNGLRIVAEKITHVRSVSIGAWIGVGSMKEEKSENGLSHFIEHMVFKGTKTRSAKDIATQMDAVGGQLNAFTSKDCTCYYAKVIDEDLGLAIDILSDLVRNALFDEKELEKERGVILEEIAMVEDTPEDLAHELLCLAQYGDQSLGMPILGPVQNIRNYGREDLIKFLKSHYMPENIVISVAGNYDINNLKNLLEKAFGDWKNVPQLDSPRHKGIELFSNRLYKNKETEQVQICLGYPGRPMGHDDIYPMAVFNNILGGGMSSRLFQSIREELGMAYAIYSYPASYINSGVLNIYAGTSPENAPFVIKQIQAEIQKLLNQGMPDDEYDQGKAQLRGSYLLGLESVSGRMQSMGRGELLLSRVNTPDEIINKIESVTKKRVLDVMEAILQTPPSAAIVGADAAKYLSDIQ